MADKEHNEQHEAQQKKRFSRRDLIKTIGITGAIVASGGLVHTTLNAKSGTESNSPHDKIGDLDALATEDKSSVVDAINEHDAKLAGYEENMSGRAVNMKYPPAPLVGAKVDGVTDDTAAVREIIKYAEEHNAKVIVPGVAVITGEIEIKKRLIIEGIGSGSGYSGKALTDYDQISGFLVKGTGEKRVRTRIRHRATASAPHDPPLSTAINIQAENVVLRDLVVFLDFDRTDASPTNYGADWDVGIFIGCRVHILFENVHVLGYWREASIWHDVTRSSYLSEFKALDGNYYSRGTVTNGADGLTLFRVFTLGGKWGLKIQGAKPQDGEEDYKDQYYDDLFKLSTDRRGNFGSSDVTAIACSFYGTNHHSKYRRDDATGDYLTDPGGGALSIDGLAGNASGALQGMRFISCRFSTWEPFRIKLDRVNRAVFIGCHSEWGSGAFSSKGDALTFNDSEVYGPISTTHRTKNLVLESFNATLRTAFLGSDDYTNLNSASASQLNQLSKGIMINGAIMTSGQADIRSGDGQAVRLRSGSKTVALFDENRATLYAGNAVRPATDNAASLGEASRRFTHVYAAGGVLTTSDRNAKTDISAIPDAVLDAWAEVNYSQFKFKDAVAKKGSDARMHIGVIAQDIEEAFKRHGLNAFAYGILGFDETAAGGQYSVRAEECLMLEAALMRRKLDRIERLMQQP